MIPICINGRQYLVSCIFQKTLRGNNVTSSHWDGYLKNPLHDREKQIHHISFYFSKSIRFFKNCVKNSC